ncbi:MAG TPA: DinB family protein [Candidatus Acidoferrum sp.]|nr:DinB family protein [Candidatus Acidoferrum sp.]
MADTMTAEQAVFLLQNVYMGPLKNESRITKKVLEAVPADKADFRPDPISRTANELVRHIAAADNRFLEAVINGVLDTNPAMIPENVKTPQQIAAWYEERFAKNFEALGKLKGEQLTKIVDFRGMFQRPAVTFVMMGLNHTIHHRGQLSSYLRCMGAKVPSLYGESYDDAQARKTAQA